MQKHLCKMYHQLDYDFTNFVVSQCLQHVSNSVHDDQYICSSCDKILKERSDENPVVPHYARYANVVTGANFLKALNQRPEYVCTCCHHMLFCKTVQQFHMEDYDISNETVKASLSQRYVMKLLRHTSDENDDMTTHKWPQFVPDDVKQDDIYVMNEYICIWCRNSLQQKKSKNAWSGMCKWSTIAWHPTRSTEYTAIGEKSDFSMNTIHNNICHEMIWWPFQSKWSTCQCSSNTRSDYRHIVMHAQWVVTTSCETKM